MIAPARRSEWERLCAEHAAARDELVRAVASFEERVHDPLGLKASLQRHPWIYAGGAAALGALIVNFLRPKDTNGAAPARQASAETGASSAVLDTVLRVAEPWLVRLAEESLAPRPQAEEPAATSGDER